MPTVDVSMYPAHAVHMIGPDARASKDFRRLCMTVEMCMSCMDETLELVRAPVWFYVDGFWYASWKSKIREEWFR